jgi:hypothetical protein
VQNGQSEWADWLQFAPRLNQCQMQVFIVWSIHCFETTTNNNKNNNNNNKQQQEQQQQQQQQQ